MRKRLPQVAVIALMMPIATIALAQQGKQSESRDNDRTPSKASQRDRGTMTMAGGQSGARGQSGPTLKIETEGRGREIEFECHATMDECLTAFDQTRSIFMGRRQGPGTRDDPDDNDGRDSSE